MPLVLQAHRGRAKLAAGHSLAIQNKHLAIYLLLDKPYAKCVVCTVAFCRRFCRRGGGFEAIQFQFRPSQMLRSLREIHYMAWSMEKKPAWKKSACSV